MVAALSCGARQDYNAFVLTHRSSLQKYGKIIRTEFRRRYGKAGDSKLNKFVTRLANEASARSNANRDSFCADAATTFQQAKVQDISLTRMVTVPASDDASGVRVLRDAVDGRLPLSLERGDVGAALSRTRGLQERRPVQMKAGRTNGPAGFVSAAVDCREDYLITISTRRFWGSGTPSAVGTSGSVSPLAIVVISVAGSPSRTSSAFTESARRCDSFRL